MTRATWLGLLARALSWAVTHPDALHHVSYRAAALVAGAASDSTLICTGPHPFYVVEEHAFVPASELVVGETLLLAQGAGVAHVTDVQVERGPPDGGTFTTYNLEVEGFHTYFVGPEGVWVHNSARAACERAFSIIEKIKMRNSGISHWDAFVQALQRTNTPARRAAFDGVLEPVTESLMQAMYKDAVTAEGVDLSKLKTVAQLKAFRETDELGSRLKYCDLEFHHSAVSAWTRRLLENQPPYSTFTDQQWEELFDEMPGLIVDVHTHRGATVDGISSFHTILNNRLPSGTRDPATILDELEAAYEDWDPDNGPRIWAAAREWLRQKGVP